MIAAPPAPSGRAVAVKPAHGKRGRVARAVAEPRARIEVDARELQERSVAVTAVAVPAEAPSTSNPLGELAESAAVKWYLKVLDEAPLVTKQWTSCSGFVLGDIAAQALTEPEFLLSRTLILGAYGFFVDAVAGHFFYNWLDANIEPGNAQTAKAVGKKILIDQLLYAPAFTCILYAYLQAANGDIAGIPEVLSDKAVPTLMANYAVWPLAHALNFYYVPTEQRILYNNFIAVCWTTWLSCLAH